MPDSAPQKIMVVDDNPSTRYSTSRVLKSVGFTVVEAATGTDAIQTASPEIALIVLDVNLPDIDGFEVCRRLRERQDLGHIPIIHLSATFVRDVDKIHGLEMGADGYLTHPCEPPVLIATVKAFLRAHEAEQAVRRNEQRFRTIFDLAPTGIALLSEELVILEVNAALCKFLAYPLEQIIGKTLGHFLHPGSFDPVPAIAEHYRRENNWRGNLTMATSQGSPVELDWHLSPFSDNGARLAMVTDITERKRIEAVRESLYARERMARADAERANRMKDDFLATLSHELRTPLNVIAGWAQILRTTQLSAADRQKAIETIDRNTKVQVQLVSDLLDVSRITSGKLNLELQIVDPQGVVLAAIESISLAAAAKSIKIRHNFEPTAGPVSGDPSRLQQIFWNLLSNAVKFTPRGGEIKVGISRVHSQVKMTVQDNGSGIDPDFLPHIFERFSQQDASTTRSHGGLGLGLAIVKHLIEMHGGSVSAESPGTDQGALFTVSLPVAAFAPPEALPALPGTDEEEAAETATRISGFVKAATLRGVRVMVVDDERDARELIECVLKETKAEVLGCASADEALAALGTFKPHVLISDVGMPGQDGYGLIKKVRAKFDFHTLPAIALTAMARPEDRRRLLLAGYQIHLAKPVDPIDMLAAVISMTASAG